MVDATHDAKRRSWVESANGHPDFPIQNLPFGIYSKRGERRAAVSPSATRSSTSRGRARRVCSRAKRNGRRKRPAAPAQPAVRARPRAARGVAGAAVGTARCRRRERQKVEGMKPLASAPGPRIACCICRRGSATSPTSTPVSTTPPTPAMFRPDNPLLPNYKWMPVAYHGRASSIRVSGTPVRRPNGQRKPRPRPSRLRPCRISTTSSSSASGSGRATRSARRSRRQGARSFVGLCLLNDWSARDIQAWEYQPLGPFLAKNFATTVSPWIVTPEALEPFRARRAAAGRRSASAAYLMDDDDQRAGGFDIDARSTRPHRGCAQGRRAASACRQHRAHLYWTVAQMVAHHTCGGCNLESGDLIGTGTISAPDGVGSMLD